MWLKTILYIIISITTFTGSLPAQPGSIKLTITNIKEIKGVLRVLLWKGPEGFPKEREGFFRKETIEVTSDSAIVVWNDIPPGEYAISLFQDINENRNFDRSRIMQTMEPFGLSGTLDFSERPVKFKDCSFNVDDETVRVNISMTYKEDLEKYR